MSFPQINYNTWLTNRIKKRQPRPGSIWCDCDQNRIAQTGKWAKCGVCGRRCSKYKKIDRKPNLPEGLKYG